MTPVTTLNGSQVNHPPGPPPPCARGAAGMVGSRCTISGSPLLPEETGKPASLKAAAAEM